MIQDQHDFTKPLIMVGGPRTGTSLTMQFLHRCGMVVGKGAERSPLCEGRIRDQYYKPVLKEGGYDPLAQRKLPPVGWQPARDPQKDRHLIDELFEWPEDRRYGHQAYGFKAIKGLLFFPHLAACFPNGVRWLVIHRGIDGWVDSLMRTGFMNAHSDEEGWRGYCERIQLRQNALIDTCDEPHEISSFFPSAFHGVVQGNEGAEKQLRELCAYVGVPYSFQAVQDTFNPTKYKGA